MDTTIGSVSSVQPQSSTIAQETSTAAAFTTATPVAAQQAGYAVPKDDWSSAASTASSIASTTAVPLSETTISSGNAVGYSFSDRNNNRNIYRSSSNLTCP